MKKNWIGYLHTRAHKKLLQLSETPFDLRSQDAVCSDVRGKFVCTSQHFSLHYWTQRIDDEVLDALQLLAEECDLVGQFCEMKQGAVMNGIAGVESENRQVLHTAVRDIFAEFPKEENLTRLAFTEIEKLRHFLHDLETGVVVNDEGESFETLLHIGIGGSDLGPRSVYEALKAYSQEKRKVFFISNVDPDDTAAVLKGRDLKRCLVTVVSKSGTTLETATNEQLVRRAFVENGLDPRHHFVAVTGKGGPMDDPQRYLRTFYMFDAIGGRFSTTSMVGLFSLGFSLGYERILAFLEGAAITDIESECPNIRKNQALLLALLGIWNHTYLGYPTVAILPYSQALHRFAAHLQQCDMESNGKSIDRRAEFVDYPTGPIVWGEPGTNGQHAFYQLLHQGREIVPVEFIGFRQSQYKEDIEVDGTTSQQKLIANMLAQAVAFAVGKNDENPNCHFAGNRPSSLLIGERLTPWSMGALLALYEAKVVFQGFTWNINSFDQEGVQLGKNLARRFLKEIGRAEAGRDSFESKILKLTGLK